MALGKLAGTPVGSSGQPAQVVHDVLALGWRWGKLRAGPGLRVLFGPHGDLTRSMTATTPTAKATIANPTRLAEMNRAFSVELSPVPVQGVEASSQEAKLDLLPAPVPEPPELLGSRASRICFRAKRAEGEQAAHDEAQDRTHGHPSRDTGQPPGDSADQTCCERVEADERSSLGIESVRLAKLSLQPFLRLLPDERRALGDSMAPHGDRIGGRYDMPARAGHRARRRRPVAPLGSSGRDSHLRGVRPRA